MNKVVINVCYGGFGLSDKAIKFLKEKYGLDIQDLFLEEHGLPRHDPRLIDVVETLGSKEASDECAKLSIKEIPGNMYQISEYDGWESIITPDEFGWIVIK